MLTVKEVTKKLKENKYDTLTLTMEEFMLWERVTDLMNKIGMTVRHFKGGVYIIVGVATHTETDETLVIYKALYGNRETYARPIDMFLEKVDKTKYPDAKQDFRFETVEIK